MWDYDFKGKIQFFKHSSRNRALKAITKSLCNNVTIHVLFREINILHKFKYENPLKCTPNKVTQK